MNSLHPTACLAAARHLGSALERFALAFIANSVKHIHPMYLGWPVFWTDMFPLRLGPGEVQTESAKPFAGSLRRDWNLVGAPMSESFPDILTRQYGQT